MATAVFQDGGGKIGELEALKTAVQKSVDDVTTTTSTSWRRRLLLFFLLWELIWEN